MKQKAEIMTKLDTGADATIIKESAARFCEMVPNYERGWTGIGGGHMTSNYHCDIGVQINGRIIPETAFIVPDDDLSEDMILGTPGLQQDELVLFPKKQKVFFLSDIEGPRGEQE